MKNIFIKGLSVLLVLVLVCSLAACAQTPQATETTQATTEPATLPPDLPTESTGGEGTITSPVTFFTMNYSIDGQAQYSLNAFDNGDGTIRVDMMSDIRKVGYLEPSVLDTIAKAVAASGAEALHERHEYEEGTSYGGMYISYEDGAMLAADFSGVLPEDFLQVYEAMEQCFRELLKEIPEYVPQPMVTGTVEQSRLEALLYLANNCGIEAVDSLMIAEIPMDDSFGFMAGLSKTDGITGGSQCGPMMMTTPYSCIVVTAEDASVVDGIVQDFWDHLDWQRWVCVVPDSAFVAVRENMVLCVMGSGDLYEGTKTAAIADGWTIAQEQSNPDYT